MANDNGPTRPLQLTREEILAKQTQGGGFSRATLAEWGVPWPAPKGWAGRLMRGEPMPTPETPAEKQARKSEERFQHRLRQGGQRAAYDRGQVLYERKGGESERLTYLDRTNDVRPLMSGRLQMPDGLRSVGNLYGDSVLMAMLGPGKPFAQEAVDGGRHGATGGVSMRMIEAQEVATLAQRRMAELDPISFRCVTKAKHGGHRPIPCRVLVDAICVHGQDIIEVALRQGWWVQGPRMPTVHRKQKIKLKDALVFILGEIDAIWGQNGIDARGILGVVEIR